MSRAYQPSSEYGKAIYGDEAVDLDLSASEERDLVGSGHLSIVPQSYEVLSDNYAAGEQGAVVELALQVENEAALTAGGHIKRVDQSVAESRAAKKAAANTRKKAN